MTINIVALIQEMSVFLFLFWKMNFCTNIGFGQIESYGRNVSNCPM